MSKIKDFFRKFSKHKNVAPLVPGFFKEPKIEDLSLHELGMLEQAKREYEKVLLQDKTIVSDELDFTSLFDEIRMNADLLLQDAIPTDFQQSLQRSILTSDTVQTIKLGLYYEQISLLERQAEVLYLALKELYEKKRFLLRQSKKTAILNGMNNLKNSIILFQSQIRAMQIKIGTNLYVVELSGSLNEKETEDVFRIAQEIIPKKYEEITSQNNSVERMMAECIRELEIYVYKHKEDVALLEEQLNELYGQVDTENPIYLKDAIRKLECYFLAFAKYGKRIVGEEFMSNFYRVKFEIMTMDIIEQGEREIELDTNKFEQKVYENIIFERIEQIRNSALDPEKITTILEFLKHDDRFDAMQILTSSPHLAMLLTVLDEEKYNELLDKFILRENWKNYYTYIRHMSNLFQWADEITLRELSKIIPMTAPGILRLINLEIYKILTNIYPSSIDGDIYYFPEGLLSFNTTSVLSNIERDCIHKIYSNMGTKKVYLPNSLEAFSLGCVERDEETDFIYVPPFQQLHLNKALQHFLINSKDFGSTIRELYVSSTLSAFGENGTFEISGKMVIQDLYIEDFEHAEELLSSENFLSFFGGFLRVYQYKPEENIKMARPIVENTLKRLVFIAEDGTKIELSTSDIEGVNQFLLDLVYQCYFRVEGAELLINHFSFKEVSEYFKLIIVKAREKYKEYLYSQRADLLDSSEQRKILQKQDE